MAFRLLHESHDTPEKVDAEFKNIERFLVQMFQNISTAPTDDKGIAGSMWVYGDGGVSRLYVKVVTGGVATWKNTTIT